MQWVNGRSLMLCSAVSCRGGFMISRSLRIETAIISSEAFTLHSQDQHPSFCGW